MLSGVDIPAAIQNLPSFVSSFDYSLTGQVFLQQPAAAGRTAHLATLSVQHAAQAIQTQGPPLMQQAQQSVCEFVTAQLQQLRDVMAQQEVQIVLEAASAAVRASAAAEGQGLDGNSPGAVRLHPTQRTQHGVLEQATVIEGDAAGMVGGNQEGMSNGSGRVHVNWLSRLSADHLVEFAEMLQIGLQEQQLPDCRQSCMNHIHQLVTGWYAVLCHAVPCRSVPCHAKSCHGVVGMLRQHDQCTPFVNKCKICHFFDCNAHVVCSDGRNATNAPEVSCSTQRAPCCHQRRH